MRRRSPGAIYGEHSAVWDRPRTGFTCRRRCLPSSSAEPPIEEFRTRAAWEKWLERRHGDDAASGSSSRRRAAASRPSRYAEALDVALCYGWIDGQSKSLDETYCLQRFTPRGSRSKWSKLNRERVARLTKAGLMQPAGLAEVERAKADGRWDAAYDSPATAKVPDDLAKALAKSAKAKKFFDSLSSTNRYAILYRLQEAKKPETRVRRLAKFVEMLARGEKFH